MRIILLGTGTPVLDVTREQSAIVVEVPPHRLLFDAGRGVTSQMLRIGLDPEQVSSVFITHHHYDHICGLGDFLLTRWHNGRQAPITVHGPPGTANIVAALLEQVYARDIAFALYNQQDAVDIRNLVRVREVTSGLAGSSEAWRVLAEVVDHGNGLGLSPEDFPCLAYRVEAEGKVIAISGDTVACEGLDRVARAADCLVQCCYLAEAEITNPAFERLARYIIASSAQAGEIAARNRVKMLVLTHIRPKSESLMRSLASDIRRAYSGELLIGQDLMVIPV